MKSFFGASTLRGRAARIFALVIRITTAATARPPHTHHQREPIVRQAGRQLPAERSGGRSRNINPL